LLAEVINPEAFSPSVRQLIEELRATENVSRQFSLVAQITHQAYEPLASSLELLRTAGAEAPELADVAQQIEARRRQNQGRLIASLHEQGLLRHSLPLEEAVDVLWALTSYDLYRMLVVERGWDRCAMKHGWHNCSSSRCWSPVRNETALRQERISR